MNPSDKPRSLEELPGGAREAMRDLLTGADGSASGELSPDVLEALAVDSPLLPPREPFGARLASYFGRHQLLLLLACFLALWAILCVPMRFGEKELRLGQPAPREVVAPQSAFVLDADETRKRQERAAALVTPAYDPDPSALGRALAELPALASNATRLARAAVAAQSATSAPAQITPGSSATKSSSPARSTLEAAFAAQAGWKAPRAVIFELAKMAPTRRALALRVAQSALSEVYVKARIRSDVPDDLSAVRPLLRGVVNDFGAKTGLSPDERAVALALSARAARVPNVVVNERETERVRREARESVARVYQGIEANSVLVREGERISEPTYAVLQQLGLVTPRLHPLDIGASGALCLMLVGSAAFYLARARRDLLRRPAALWLVAFVPVVFVGLFRAILRVPHADFLMVPLAATSAMLVTVLLDTRVGLPVGFVVAALCALMAHSDAGLFLGATLSAWVGSLSVTNLSSRIALGRSALILAATNALLALALGTLRGEPLDDLLSGTAWLSLAGLVSVAAMAAGALFLEKPFGITSHLRLLELLSPDETIIRRMQVEAPGTYTHSLMVATLGEAAAKVVGADPLLCRVAGLYHDIGKLRRPHCFIENQSGDNIHDRIAPTLSALLIKAHVKDGLELGRALRLPLPVMDAIASHHGRGLIAFFYARARATMGEENVDERLFRYAGPRPQTREAAILMLADAIEASARSLSPATPETIATHIETIVAARLGEGELDECDLSLRDISLVREAFVSTLRGALHGRISYPDAASLGGELTTSSNDWVRQTLGDDARKNGEGSRKNGDGSRKKSESGEQESVVVKPNRSQLRRLRRTGGASSALAQEKTDGAG